MSKSNPFVQSVHHSNDQPYSSMARRVLLKHATMLTTQISHAVITFKIPSPHFWMGSVRVWASRVFCLQWLKWIVMFGSAFLREQPNVVGTSFLCLFVDYTLYIERSGLIWNKNGTICFQRGIADRRRKELVAWTRSWHKMCAMCDTRID